MENVKEEHKLDFAISVLMVSAVERRYYFDEVCRFCESVFTEFIEKYNDSVVNGTEYNRDEHGLTIRLDHQSQEASLEVDWKTFLTMHHATSDPLKERLKHLDFKMNMAAAMFGDEKDEEE